ncbi:MAG TPA: SH3 domain-containing protein [Vicinamibacterales bacterium]|nr:SH3 domain-containing protein [Vicinamibacterales bacterium]
MKRLAGVVVAVLISVVPVFAQQKATVTGNAPIFLVQNPAAGTIPLRTAAAGTVLTVLQEEGEWVQVQFQDPQWGLRTGWVRTALLRIDRPELRPMDLSVTPGENERPAPGVRRESEIPSPASQERVAPESREAGQPKAMHQGTRTAEKGWLDVNVGAASARQTTRNTEATWLRTGEIARFTTAYKTPTGADFDFGGGYMFTPVLGAGVSVSGTAHQSAADITLTLPHPNYYNRPATDSGQTEDVLKYTEGAVHLQLMLNIPTSSNGFRARVFGGPSYFTVRGDALTEVRWNQAWFLTASEVDITGTAHKQVTAEAWGFHAGADLSYFFSRSVGIGGLVRYSGGSVEIEDDDVMADEPFDLKLGGVQAAFGLRLRFGKK